MCCNYYIQWIIIKDVINNVSGIQKICYKTIGLVLIRMTEERLQATIRNMTRKEVKIADFRAFSEVLFWETEKQEEEGLHRREDH